MRIKTNYNVTPSKGEICIEASVTDGSQYMSVREVLQRYIRGESLDIHDYTQDNPMDCKDKFDVLDAAIQIDEQIKNRKNDKKPGVNPEEKPGVNPEKKPGVNPEKKPGVNPDPDEKVGA